MNEDNFEKLVSVIKMMEFSSHFSEKDYEQFRTVFKARTFRKDQKIMWRGQKGLFFFIIGTGKISVKVKGEELEEKVVAKLSPGDFVGEIALLYNRPRVADCYADDDDTLLFFLDQRSFFDCFIAKPTVRRAMEQIAERRFTQTSDITSQMKARAEGTGEKTEAPDAGPIQVTEVLPEVTEEEPEIIVKPAQVAAVTPEVAEEEPEIIVKTPPVAAEPPEVIEEEPEIIINPPQLPIETPADEAGRTGVTAVQPHIGTEQVHAEETPEDTAEPFQESMPSQDLLEEEGQESAVPQPVAPEKAAEPHHEPAAPEAAPLVAEELPETTELETAPPEAEETVPQEVEETLPVIEEGGLFEETLKKLRYMSLVSPESTAELKNYFRETAVSQGATLQLNDPDGAPLFALLAEGELSIKEMDQSGREITHSPLGEGDFLGEIPLIFDIPLKIICNAEKNATLFVIDRDNFQTKFLCNPLVRASIEERALRRIFEGDYKNVSTHPHFGNVLKNYLENFTVEFYS